MSSFLEFLVFENLNLGKYLGVDGFLEEVNVNDVEPMKADTMEQNTSQTKSAWINVTLAKWKRR